MRILTMALMACLTLAGLARAAPSAKDRAAIAAIEDRLLPSAPDLAARTLTARMAALKIPGVSIAFIENGKVKWVRAYGVADVADKRSVTPETLFQAASLSKMVAAAGALRLVELGKLDLDENVNARLKTWQVPASAYTATQKVTMRRLLSHTAGLTISGVPGYVAGKPIPTIVQMLNGTPPANTPPVRSFEPPGQSFAYSGGGYAVAQLVMAEAGGAPYPELLARLVLKPAGMWRSTLAQPLPDRLMLEAAKGYNKKGDAIPGGRNTYPEVAAGGLWATPTDYGRFLIGLQNAYIGRRSAFLAPSSSLAMMTPISAGYGLGTDLRRRGGRPAFGHGGTNWGFQCASFAFLDGSRQGVVVMTNGEDGNLLIGEIMQALAKTYDWGEFETVDGQSRRAPFLPPMPK